MEFGALADRVINNTGRACAVGSSHGSHIQDAPVPWLYLMLHCDIFGGRLRRRGHGTLLHSHCRLCLPPFSSLIAGNAQYFSTTLFLKTIQSLSAHTVSCFRSYPNECVSYALP